VQTLNDVAKGPNFMAEQRARLLGFYSETEQFAVQGFKKQIFYLDNRKGLAVKLITSYAINCLIFVIDLVKTRKRMKTLYRYIIVFALLVAAIALYSAGNQTGMFIFIVLGFLLEGAFWFGLFPMKRSKNSK
jgi:hypothetical protein